MTDSDIPARPLPPEENDAAIEAMIRFQEENPDVWGDQDENGVDLARLRENLKLTPAERLDKHEKARRLVLHVKGAGERSRVSLRHDKHRSES